MGVVNFLFSFDGRIGRLAYFLGNIVFGIIVGLLMLTFGIGTGVQDQSMVMQAVEIVIGFTSLVSCCALVAKRFHDLNKSGWWMLASVGAVVGGWMFSIIVPILGSIAMIIGFLLPIWQCIELLFFKGDASSNDFGAPPKVMRQLTGADSDAGAPAPEPEWAKQAIKKAAAAAAQTSKIATARTATDTANTTAVTRVARTAKMSPAGPATTPNGFGRRTR
jgi:uncharacterized membrane protein YhaH (DUF805 family)